MESGGRVGALGIGFQGSVFSFFGLLKFFTTDATAGTDFGFGNQDCQVFRRQMHWLYPCNS
jgi:hypothetical protein